MILESVDDGVLVDDERVAARGLVLFDIRQAGDECPDRASGTGAWGKKILKVIG